MAAWREIVNGSLKDGEFHIHKEKQLLARLARRRDCDLVITIEKLHATRSLQQNAYYWPVVVGRVTALFRKCKWITADDPQMVHEILKSQFMDPELVRLGKIRGYLSDTGLLLGTSTTDLNKLEFIEYCDRIIEHAAAHWRDPETDEPLYIPPPDPHWRENAEREADEHDERVESARIIEAEFSRVEAASGEDSTGGQPQFPDGLRDADDSHFGETEGG